MRRLAGSFGQHYPINVSIGQTLALQTGTLELNLAYRYARPKVVIYSHSATWAMDSISDALAIAIAHHRGGRLKFAEEIYRRLLAAEPHCADAWHLLGVAALQQGDYDGAVRMIRDAIRIAPATAAYHCDLGSALQAQERLDEAVSSYLEAIRLAPLLAGPYNNLGNTLRIRGALDQAIIFYRRAIELSPAFAEAHNNLGTALQAQGLLQEARSCYAAALRLEPQSPEVHSNLIYAMQFGDGSMTADLASELRQWNVRHARPAMLSAHSGSNCPSTDRRIRVGYVSPDLREHPVALFLLPLLESHDRERFEIACYSSVNVPDPITSRCRALVDLWRDVLALSDSQLAEAIRADGIDILVDLSMHMAHNRLLVFARKPAPVQVTYLAYCGTTGLRTIDYRFTDPYLDPPASDEMSYSETSVRLPETYWCYRPLIETPGVTRLPARNAGYVTFGCLNNFCKASEQALTAWGSLLAAIPGSRLLLHAHPGSHRERVYERFTERGIARERVEFVAFLPMSEYFEVYRRIDVALDPFPYNGGTTTCDALWMGVPVVSLAGKTAVGRAGRSILSNVGLADLVASDVDQYVAIAAGLAADVPRLADLRATLRQRMQRSPLMDGPRLTRHIEAAYRQMWHRWCGSRVS